MFTALLSIFILCGLLFYLIVLANKKFLITTLNSEKNSFANTSSASQFDFKKELSFLVDLGQVVKSIFPLETLENLKSKCFHIGRTEDDLHRSIGLAFFVAGMCMIAFIGTNIIYFLVMAFILPAAIISDIYSAYKKYMKNLEASVVHLVECIKVMMIKSETSLSNALMTIADGLPEQFFAAKKEVIKIYSLAQQKGLKNTLMEVETDLDNYQDFVSLLISINEGTSKQALKQNIDTFLVRAKEVEAENKQADNENLQFLLLFPIIMMFLVTMFPFIDSIQFTMSNTGIGKV